MAFIIAEELKVENFDEKNLKCCCPFHAEDTPSFIWNSKALSFRCFGACGRSYDIIDVFMMNGNTYIEAVQKLFELANIKYAFGEHRVKTNAQYKYPKGVPVNDKSKISAYYEQRKISKKTLDYADVREDEHGNIVFNYYDLNDTLCMVKFRPSRKVPHGEIKNWCEKGSDTMPLLFNMNRINTDNPLLICCGESDALAAIEAGYVNVVSIPLGDQNTHWVEHCWDFLEQFDNIIICADNDASGIKFQKDIVYRLGSWRTKLVDLPTCYIDSNDKKWNIKDLNEVLYWFGKDIVLEAILNAKDSPVDSVSDFSEIKNVDLNEVDGITTGIKSLDKNLMKLFYGTFNIVTGVNGSGKSSFLSQLVCESLDQGKNAFMYSGELPNFQSKNWINYILAGQRHLREYKFNETTYWKVTSEAQDSMNEYYKGRLFIFKDGYDHKIPTLMKSMEDTVRKYGAKLIILDNLTSINLECSDNNKYNKQEELVSQLIDFAKKFNVAVILVVHPHKIEAMRRLTKMDVQGISAIIDLAHRIISLYRVTNEDKKGKPKNNGKGWYKEPIKYDVLCDILKDRMLGFEGSTVGLYYDRPSRRFFEDECHLDRKYRWDSTEYEGGLPFPPPQLLQSDTEQEVYGYVTKE